MYVCTYIAAITSSITEKVRQRQCERERGLRRRALTRTAALKRKQQTFAFFGARWPKEWQKKKKKNNKDDVASGSRSPIYIRSDCISIYTCMFVCRYVVYLFMHVHMYVCMYLESLDSCVCMYDFFFKKSNVELIVLCLCSWNCSRQTLNLIWELS